MKFVIALFAILVTGTVTAQSAVPKSNMAQVRFTVGDAQLEPVQYSLEILQDGSGSYTASYTATKASSAALPAKQVIHIHDPLLSQVFLMARKYHFFAIQCQQKHSHVAFTGNKTLAYTGPDGSGSCTFNYSHDQSINQIATELIAVAYTLEIGTRLAQEHRYDRLSLDAELAALQEATQEQRAIELGNIAPELNAIANDDAVMNRARERARALLLEPASLQRSSN